MAELTKYERKCDSWLIDFGKWTLPRSEAPESFILWTGLFTMASALRRHVKIPKTIFGSWEASPNLYILFIAQAGKARKSTTANYTEDLIDEIPGITKSPELITKESLLDRITKSDDASMCIVAPEFGEFIVKSGVDMYGFLTNMYDGKKNISASTIGRGHEFVEKPCVNLLGATTPEWVAANMPESVIGGGFASRVIFIHEPGVRRRKLYYDDLDFKELIDLRKNLVDDLAHIANNLHGEFKIEENAKKWMSDWYDKTADSYSEADYKMHGFFERLPAHIHKVAMLLHVSYSDELVIHQKDFEDAIALLKQVERGLPDTFKAIGKNPYTVDMSRILDVVQEYGKINKRDLMSKFFHVATPNMLNELLGGLYDMGRIKTEIVGIDTIISLNTAHISGNGKAADVTSSTSVDPQ